MTQKQVEYFIKAFELGSIASAANALYVSRSVVSRALSDLEEEIGCQLFTRSKEGVEPSESARLLYKLFKEFHYGYIDAMNAIRKLEGHGNNRLLRLGITPTNGKKFYELIYREFRQAYPDVCVTVMERPANQVLSLILDGLCDAVLTPSREQLSVSFGSVELFRARIVLGISSDHRLAARQTLTIADLLDLPLGYLEAPMPIENILLNCFAAFGKEPNVVIRTSQLDLLRRMTEGGHIATILPNDMLEDWTGAVGIPLDFFSASTHRFVWSKTISHNSAFCDFLEFIEGLAQGKPRVT